MIDKLASPRAPAIALTANPRCALHSLKSRRWNCYAGTALRINPDGSGFTVVGHNFRNPYELAQDSFGGLWQSDNDDDGNAR